MKQQLKDYTFIVSWYEKDNEYLGTCLEFPSLSSLDSDPYIAFKGIRELVIGMIDDCSEDELPKLIKPYDHLTGSEIKNLVIQGCEKKISVSIESSEFKTKLNPYVLTSCQNPDVMQLGLRINVTNEILTSLNNIVGLKAEVATYYGDTEIQIMKGSAFTWDELIPEIDKLFN